MTKRQWNRQLFFAIALTIITVAMLASPSSRDAGFGILIIPALAIHAWYQVIRWALKRRKNSGSYAPLFLFSIAEYHKTPPRIKILPRIWSPVGISPNRKAAKIAATTGSQSLEADTKAGEKYLRHQLKIL